MWPPGRLGSLTAGTLPGAFSGSQELKQMGRLVPKVPDAVDTETPAVHLVRSLFKSLVHCLPTSWDVKEPLVPAPVPVAPRFLQRVSRNFIWIGFFLLLYIPWTSSRRGSRGPPPHASSSAPAVSRCWTLKPQLLHRNISENTRRLVNLHVYIYRRRAFGLECCAMVEFVEDGNVHFVVIFI